MVIRRIGTKVSIAELRALEGLECAVLRVTDTDGCTHYLVVDKVYGPVNSRGSLSYSADVRDDQHPQIKGTLTVRFNQSGMLLSARQE